MPSEAAPNASAAASAAASADRPATKPGDALDSIAAYDFDLPPELIARHPAARRDASRLLVLPRTDGPVRHRLFRDLVDELRAGDRLVVNDTFVRPARLVGVRDRTQGRWEGLAVDRPEWHLPEPQFAVLAKTKGTPQPDETVTLSRGDNRETLRLVARRDGGVWVVEATDGQSAANVLGTVGHPPLPPYILKARRTDAERDAASTDGNAGDETVDDAVDNAAINTAINAVDDAERYQTVYAERSAGGSVAAPTAGLHFTPELLDTLRDAGIGLSTVRLDVGEGTFRPVKADRLDDHAMHAESVVVSAETIDAITETRRGGGRVVAVGTTTARALEASGGQPFAGPTDLFIRPGYQFAMIDGLLTNFHLPKSTLLVMISAVAGRDRVLAAYHEAIAERYRFFSYGDAMLLLDR